MAKLRIMVVDDDRIALDYLTNMIRRAVGETEIAATAINGNQGLVKYGKCRPNLIISDIRMPFLDGLEMFRRIREENPLVYFIFLTSYSEFSYAKEALELGANGYLLKDECSEASIWEAVRPLLEKNRERTETALWSIERELQAFCTEAQGGRPNLKETIRHLFSLFEAGSDETDFKLLLEKCTALFQKSYRQHGKQDYFRSPTADSPAALCAWVLEQIDILGEWRGQSAIQFTPTVSNVVLYIQKYYMVRDLSIQDIAKDVFVTPNWLSAIFRKETGRTINEYITDVRIKKAKELLLQGKYKIYEIAEMVGYGSSQYFSRVFYQQTGHTPQRYRKDDDE